jgi:hypothetical protein
MIRKMLQAILCVILCPVLLAEQSVTNPGNVLLPKDTAIHLRLDQDVSSAAVREGQNVRYIVTDDVVAGGVVVIPAGTAAYQKVTTVVSAGSGKFCRDLHNGWFAVSDTVVVSGQGVEMKMKAWRESDLPKDPPKTPEQKALEVAMAPLQIPAMAILIAAPIVLIPLGIASGIHDSLHKPRALATQPGPTVPSQIETLPVPSTTVLSPETPAAPQSPSSSSAPQTTRLTVATLPLLGTAAPQRSAPAPSASVPCQANTQEEVWKASEARVQTYYLVRNYTVRGSLPPATVVAASVE